MKSHVQGILDKLNHTSFTNILMYYDYHCIWSRDSKLLSIQDADIKYQDVTQFFPFQVLPTWPGTMPLEIFKSVCEDGTYLSQRTKDSWTHYCIQGPLSDKDHQSYEKCQDGEAGMGSSGYNLWCISFLPGFAASIWGEDRGIYVRREIGREFILVKDNSSNHSFCSDHNFSFRKVFSCSLAYLRLQT